MTSPRERLLHVAVDAGSHVFLCDEDGCDEFLLVGATDPLQALWLRSFPEAGWGWAWRAGWEHDDHGRWYCPYDRRSVIVPAIPRPEEP